MTAVNWNTPALTDLYQDFLSFLSYFENPEFMKIYGHAYDSDCGKMSQMLSEPIRKLCEERGVEFLDAQEYAHAGEDGLHLSADSHKKLATKLMEVITP
jgi:lysophospholipase L1-like esterase